MSGTAGAGICQGCRLWSDETVTLRGGEQYCAGCLLFFERGRRANHAMNSRAQTQAARQDHRRTAAELAVNLAGLDPPPF